MSSICISEIRKLMFNITDQESQAILQWLDAPDPHANHVANRKKRLPQTGNWLLASKEYEVWFDGTNSFLWLYGIRKFPSFY